MSDTEQIAEYVDVYLREQLDRLDAEWLPDIIPLESASYPAAREAGAEQRRKWQLVRAPIVDLISRLQEALSPPSPPLIHIGELTEEARAQRRSPPITIWFGTGGNA